MLVRQDRCSFRGSLLPERCDLIRMETKTPFPFAPVNATPRRSADAIPATVKVSHERVIGHEKWPEALA